MVNKLDSLFYRTLFRVETLKRTMPVLLLLVLAVALTACGKKK